MKQEYKIVDGWEIVPKSHIQNLREVISREGDNGVEQDRVVSIVEDLFTDAPEEVGYYFSECHWGVEGFMDPEDFYNTWDTEDNWSTVYDSSAVVVGIILSEELGASTTRKNVAVIFILLYR